MIDIAYLLGQRVKLAPGIAPPGYLEEGTAIGITDGGQRLLVSWDSRGFLRELPDHLVRVEKTRKRKC